MRCTLQLNNRAIFYNNKHRARIGPGHGGFSITKQINPKKGSFERINIKKNSVAMVNAPYNR